MSLSSRIREGRPSTAAVTVRPVEHVVVTEGAGRPVSVELALHRDDFHLVQGRITLREGVPMSPFTRAALRRELPVKEVDA